MPFDVHDHAEVQASLTRWRANLAHNARVLSHREQLVANSRRAKQRAEVMVDRRSGQLKKLSASGPRGRALAIALKDVGIVEHPAGSNGGPRIDAMQHRFGVAHEPWCGMAVGTWAEEAGAKLSPRIAYTPYIFDDAVHGANGLDTVVWHNGFQHGAKAAHTFDLVLFDFGGPTIEHVGALRAPWNGRSTTLLTVEGNTSFGDGGSQSNGGCVAKRERSISLVHSIVSVKWPH